MADYKSKRTGQQVEELLDKASTALQAEQYKGTVTGVKMNGSTKNPSNGVVDLGTVVTDVTGKQDKLVSGSNIKTINGQSILGSGDLSIAGGGDSGEIGIDEPSATIQEAEGGGRMIVFTAQPGGITIISLYGLSLLPSDVVIVGLFDIPQNEYDENGEYVGDAKWAHYHLVIYGGSISMPLAIGTFDAVGGNIIFPNNAYPTIESNSCIEVDILAEKYSNGGQVYFVGYGLFTRF